MARHTSSKSTIICLVTAMCVVPYQTASAMERVGNAAAVRGDVQIAAISGVRAVGKNVASGEPIFLGDKVTTGAKGRLQIMLLDETVFTIGPKAAIIIDKFVYDPSTSKGKVAATILKGTFRFVTGKVSKRDPKNMVVKLPVGSIGVRGTSVAGHTDGVSATVVLLGPGPNTNTGERVGSITVSGLGAGLAGGPVNIVRPGFATRIAGADQPPTSPVRLPPGQLTAITGQLSGPPPPGPGPIEDATKDEPPPGEVTGDTLADGEGGELLVKLLAPPPEGTEEFKPPPGDATTYEQLRSITSGTAMFSGPPRPIVVSGTVSGSYKVNYSYNFGTQAAMGNVQITTTTGFNTIGMGSFPLLANPFADATKTGPVDISEGPLVVSPLGGNATFQYKFLNTNGAIFTELAHKLSYTDGVTGTGVGKLTR